MAELLIDEPDAHVFWTAFDPLDLASESIDPLGFMAGYIALADRILPGFTTITTVPRYASMLCYALQAGINASGGANAEDPSTRRKRIMEHLKLLERAWALACGLAEGAGGLGDIGKDRQDLFPRVGGTGRATGSLGSPICRRRHLHQR